MPTQFIAAFSTRGIFPHVKRAAIRIEVNGAPTEIPEGATVRSLLEQLGLGDALVAVERNEEVVPRAEHAVTMLAQGDRVEVVHFVGGG